MTGEIVDFGGRRPSKVDDDKALSEAKACLAAHDPFQPVFDFLDRATSRIEAAVQHIGAPIPASSLNDDQIKVLTYATERAAERGVGIYAKRIASWHQAIVGGAFVAGLTIGIMGTLYVASSELDAARIEVPAVLSSIPASDLAEWATLIRANPSPSTLIANGRVAKQPNGQRAAAISLWIDLPPRPSAPPQ